MFITKLIKTLIVADVERLRRPMQQITDYLLSTVGTKSAAILASAKKVR
jgi:hypothetical protein